MSEIEYTGELVCPLGKYPLNQTGEYLECSNCGAKFPVAEGIPLLLIDDAVLPEGVNNIEELKCFKK
ncbi:MAG TPA: Trm112 family protein [Ignavibacteria bacterium]|nr:hypothetical protein [Bacteroidota bacterium]HRE10935.1 Trm112 family protein [Ignavibacteria bacterium]HRF66718.1 Trm112 family protein [Ignavibacteria bacterium]HRJ04063.1 Trm112 family protein [Ignavibacteria bacterium]